MLIVERSGESAALVICRKWILVDPLVLKDLDTNTINVYNLHYAEESISLLIVVRR